MEFRQLVYFVAVAEERGFGRAAERLHIVQPAVSQQISRLERELGVRLFDRSPRRVRLTEAGERLLPEARSVLAAIDRTRRAAADLAATEELRLGTSQGLGEQLEQGLERLDPRVRVRLLSMPLAARLDAVRSGELDAAFVRIITTATDLEVIPLWDEPLTAAIPATHPLAAGREVCLGQLAVLPLRSAPRSANPPFHELLVRACAAAGFEPLPGPPLTSLQDALAEIGTGAPSWTVLYVGAADRTPVRRVAFRPITGLRAQTGLAVPTGPPSAPVRSLLDVFRREPSLSAGDGRPDRGAPIAGR
jgi:DNA-binding transcriptional LysR family regulator